VVGLGNKHTHTTNLLSLCSSSSSSLSLCVCVISGVPIESGGGGMSWVLVVNLLRIGIQNEQVGKIKMVALSLQLLLFEAYPIFVLSDMHV